MKKFFTFILGVSIFTSSCSLANEHDSLSQKMRNKTSAGVYSTLICMEHLMKRKNYLEFSELIKKDAWIIIENSDLSPEEIENIYNQSQDYGKGSQSLGDCVHFPTLE